MRIDRVHVYGFEPALHSMRNPMESWDKSDSTFAPGCHPYREWGYDGFFVPETPFIGPKDLALIRSLITAGRPSHRKFIRLINVWADIQIPRYAWQELDTYRVGATRMSCSTMFKLGTRNLDRSDFQDGDVDAYDLRRLNRFGERYRAATGEKKVELLVKIKRHLPEGFLQMATYHFNYEVALAVYADRKNHRMPEWSGEDGLCDFIASLPYMALFLGAIEEKHRKEETP